MVNWKACFLRLFYLVAVALWTLNVIVVARGPDSTLRGALLVVWSAGLLVSLVIMLRSFFIEGREDKGRDG